jgi:hypothetical protein
MEIIEVIDSVYRLADSPEDPVQVLWRLENDAREARLTRME